METTLNTQAVRSTHPLVIIAAVAVTLFSAVGIAALMGWLPSSTGQQPSPFPSGLEPKAALEQKAEVAPVETRKEERAVHRETQATPKVAARAAVKPAAGNATKPTASMPPTQVAAVEPPPAPVAAAPAPAPMPAEPPVAAQPPRPPLCNECGTIETVRAIQQQQSPSGIGAVAGGLLGGIVGHQVGAGRGRDIATAVGAVGGAIAGNQVERGRNTTSHYEVTVRFDDNTTQRLTLNEAPAWRPGDRVRVVGGALRPL